MLEAERERERHIYYNQARKSFARFGEPFRTLKCRDAKPKASRISRNLAARRTSVNITSNLRKNREAAVVQSEGETEAAAKQAGGRSSDDRGGCSASFTSILDPEFPTLTT